MQFTNLSPIWPIPEPPSEVTHHSRKRPALRVFPSERPRIKLEGVPLASLENSESQNSHSGRKRKFGLGIENSSSFPDPVRAITPDLEKGGRSPNIAERIEERIWQYNLSGNVIKRWLLEIISWWVSALSMAAIVGVLIYYRDGKLPRWPCGLTLNAYIAVLSKTSGAALTLPVSEALGQLKWSWFQGKAKTMWDFEIFDNASRGPWGSFLLLIRTKGKALAAFGALITLFALALDPFFQQVVDFPERWALNGTSQIPRVIQYKPTIGVQIKGGQQVALQDQSLQAVADAFFYDNGTQPVAFGTGIRADIPLSCPSSNCTWPSYETLGVCSQCVEVPQLLTWGCFNTTLDWVGNLTGFNTNATSGRMCGFFLNATSGAPVMMSGYKEELGGVKGEVLITRILPLVTNPKRTSLYDGSIHFKHIRNPIVDALIVGALNGADSVYHNQTPTAHECVVSWCVKTIKSSYYLATYQEEVTQTFFNTTDGPYPWEEVSFRQTAGLNSTDQFYLPNGNISIQAPRDGRNISWYGVSNDTAFATIFSFDDIFPSFITAANATMQPFLRYKVAQKGPLLRNVDLNPWVLPNNVTHHMERFATALTNAIRSSNSHEMFMGLAYDRENFVSVRWEWLTLPLGLLILSLIFLVATIVKTSKERDQVGVWKTSALATLLYGLPDHYQERITNRASLGTPRAKAKKLKVKLLPTKGWRVSGNLFSPVTPNPNIKNNEPQPMKGWRVSGNAFTPATSDSNGTSNKAPPGWI